MADLIEHPIMIETGKTLDPSRAPVSLHIDLNVLRLVQSGSRMEEVERMIRDLEVEIEYIKQRLGKRGFSVQIGINRRRPPVPQFERRHDDG